MTMHSHLAIFFLIILDEVDCIRKPDALLRSRHRIKTCSYHESSLPRVISLISQPQTPSHTLPHSVLVLRPAFPPHLRRLHVRRTFIVRLSQHAHHAEEDLLHALNGAPSLIRILISQWIVTRVMQDRYADFAIRIDCCNLQETVLANPFIDCPRAMSPNSGSLTVRMPQLPFKSHLRWIEWVVLREFQHGGEDSTLVRCALRSLNKGFPGEEIIFADGTCGNAVRRRLGDILVFVEKPSRCYSSSHSRRTR